MKDRFKEYHQYSKKEFKKMWQDCLFVFDTNTLLNMYRYRRNTVDAYFKILTELKKKNQIWIPYQVGYEFYENRINVISEYEKSYDDILSILESAKEDIESKYKDHPFLNLEEINGEISKGLLDAEKKIKKAKKDHPRWLKKDDVLENIKKIFDGSVGEEYDEKELIKIKEDGVERYDKKIPPGFKDNKKRGDSKFGDLILWNQIIDKAKEIKKPIIFVSGDVKEDWWLEKNGKKIMPLPQLKKEMYDKAGIDFHIYTAEQFLKLSDTNETKIDERMLEEVRKIGVLEEDKIISHRKFLDKRHGKQIFFEKHLVACSHLIEDASMVYTELNHSENISKNEKELKHVLHRLRVLANRMKYNYSSRLVIFRLSEAFKSLHRIFSEMIHDGNIDGDIHLKIREIIVRIEILEHKLNSEI